MSVRAHRVSKIEWDAADTFSLHDEKLVEFLDINQYLDSDGCGIVWVSIENLKEALSMAEELELDSDSIDNFNADIQFSLDAGEETVIYYLM